MPMPQITAIYAALLGLLMVVLAVRVARYRQTRLIGIGDGGDRDLVKRIRAHANAVENVPMALLLLLILELTQTQAAWLHVFGLMLLIGRLLHALGLSRHAGSSSGRLIGIALTWLAMLAMCLLLLWRAVLIATG